MRFYIGLHQLSDAKHFDKCFISVNRLRPKKSIVGVKEWIMDSGAFTEISKHGRYRHDVSEYAKEIRRWAGVGRLSRAVSQDWMCEPFILEKTGHTTEDHQRFTIERYQDLLSCDTGGVDIMPVLQGYLPDDYRSHIEQYGNLLKPNCWVGVGSVCKRNSDPKSIVAVLKAIRQERPDLRLHGFGVKITSLREKFVCDNLYSADSMAWSFHARKNGRNPNDWHEAEGFRVKVERLVNRHNAI